MIELRMTSGDPPVWAFSVDMSLEWKRDSADKSVDLRVRCGEAALCSSVRQPPR